MAADYFLHCHAETACERYRSKTGLGMEITIDFFPGLRNSTGKSILFKNLSKIIKNVPGRWVSN